MNLSLPVDMGIQEFKMNPSSASTHSILSLRNKFTNYISLVSNGGIKSFRTFTFKIAFLFTYFFIKFSIYVFSIHLVSFLDKVISLNLLAHEIYSKFLLRVQYYFVSLNL